MDRVTFSALVWQEAPGFVSQCPELGVASCGDSVEAAMSMLRDAVETYLASVDELGLRAEVCEHRSVGRAYSTTFDVALPWAS